MKINRKELLKALEAVKPGLSSKEIIEQSTSFAFMNGNIITYNDEIAVRHPIDLDIEGAIRASELYSLLSKSTDEEITLVVTENELKIKGGRSRSGIRLEAEIKLPLEELGDLDDWNEIPKGFLKGLKMASFCTSQDMSKPTLTCVHVHSRYIESSDGYRLMRIDMGKKAGKVFDKPILLPGSAIKNLIRYPIKEFTTTPGWVHFRAKGGLIFSCRSFEDTFPEIDHFFEVEGPQIELPKNILEILDKAQIFSEGDTAWEEEVKISVKGNKITIKGEGEYGWFQESAKCSYDGEELNFSISPAFLYDIIAHLQQCTISETHLKFEGDNFEHVICLIY